MMRLLDTPDAMASASADLARLCPVMARLHETAGPPPLRKRPPGLPGLATIVIGQMVSTASAAAIGARFQAAFDPMEASALAAATDLDYAAIGLSRPKIRTFRAIAAAILSGSLPLDGLHALAPDEVRARLVAIPGIGAWTAELYCLFCLGHVDAFAAGDLALQEAARQVFDLPARPDARTLAALAETWRPYRGVAAGHLWAHYARVKSREGAPA